jgi:peptide/nickel transport system substrate-binding protein
MPARAPLTLALALLVTLGCSLGAPPAPPPIVSAYHPSAARPTGGTAVLADFEEPQALHPLAARTDAELRAGTLLFAPLWGIGPNLLPYPDLAGRVPTAANGAVRTQRGGRSMTVDVRLVPGLRWSDGQPITASDVIFTWQALRDTSLRPLAPAGLEHLVRMDRRSDTELVWTFDEAYAPYVQLGASLFPLPAHRLAGVAPDGLARDGFFARPDVVSGPFALAEDVPGDHLTLAANPRYSDGRAAAGAYPDGDGPFHHAPDLERVVLQAAPSKTAELQSLLAQGVDAGFHLLPDDLVDLQAATGTAPLVTTGLRDEFLAPNHAVDAATGPTQAPGGLGTRPPPWADDARVLQALDLAVDRSALVRDVLAGAGRPARGLYPRALTGFGASSPLPPGPDVEAATRLLAAAGWQPGPDGVRTNGGRRLAFRLVAICGRAGLDRELDLLRRQWLAAGAAVTTGCEQRDAFLQHLASGGYDMALASQQWAADPSAWAAVGSGCRDQRLDTALGRVTGTLDPAARRAAAQAVEREWLTARCTIPLFEWPEVRQVSARLRNVTPVAAAADTWNAADWWLAPA